MTIYFHSTESFQEPSDAERGFYAGRLPGYLKVSVLDTSSGETLMEGNLRSVINKLKYL